MFKTKNITYIFCIYTLCSPGALSHLLAVDFNNTQVNQETIEESLNWVDVQDRNGILYSPNGKQPYSGFIKGVFLIPKFKFLLRILSGVEQVSVWRENGIPVYSVEIIPGSMGMVGIPESIEKLDGSQFHGLARFWYETGHSMLESRYSFGKRNGITRSWYKNGNLKVEENYKDGVKDGNARSWFENGKKWMNYTHWNDKRDGPLIWWYENGEKRQEGNYKDGQRFGEWTYYKEDGTTLYRKVFRDGKSISTKYGDED